MTKHYYSAGTFLFREENRILYVLLIYKKWSEKDQGWVPPKGTIESGEKREDAAIRETREETGIQNIELVDFLDEDIFEFSDPYNNNNEKSIKTTYWYVAKTNDMSGEKKLTNGEKTQLDEKWIQVDEAIELLRFPNHKELLRKALQIIRN